MAQKPYQEKAHTTSIHMQCECTRYAYIHAVNHTVKDRGQAGPSVPHSVISALCWQLSLRDVVYMEKHIQCHYCPWAHCNQVSRVRVNTTLGLPPNVVASNQIPSNVFRCVHTCSVLNGWQSDRPSCIFNVRSEQGRCVCVSLCECVFCICLRRGTVSVNIISSNDSPAEPWIRPVRAFLWATMSR